MRSIYETGEFNLIVWIGFGLLLSPASISADESESPLWPRYRHDSSRAGISRLKGGLEKPPVLKWTVDLGGEMQPSEFAYDRDLDGDSDMEILIGSGDGWRFALDEKEQQCRVLWKIKLSKRRLGSPILADLNGDGTAEILVPDESGRMHCLGK